MTILNNHDIFDIFIEKRIIFYLKLFHLPLLEKASCLNWISNNEYDGLFFFFFYYSGNTEDKLPCLKGTTVVKVDSNEGSKSI